MSQSSKEPETNRVLDANGNPLVEVCVSFFENGTFTASRVDKPKAVVVSGTIADVAGRISNFVVRDFHFDGVTLDEDDVRNIQEVDQGIWRNAALKFSDSRFASKRDAKELFSRPLGFAIEVERCSLADHWDSRWFFSSVAVKNCHTVYIPAAIIPDGNMPENVDSLVGWLTRTTSGVAQAEPLTLEVRFPLYNRGQLNLFKTLRMRLVQAFLKSGSPCTYEVVLHIRNGMRIVFPSTTELAHNGRTGQDFVQHFEPVDASTNRHYTCLWTFRDPDSP
ncbi:hypothetical protein AAVH_38479 [Aphelenchoides avenae]|nr:hypothetical protein AAVH_38479 [Aphelenchus avenae]